MAIDLDDFVLEVVARVHAPDMGAKRAFEALRVVVVVQEIVAAIRVSGQLGVIALGSERERRTTAPAAHDLRRQQVLLRRAGGVLRQEPAERGHILMQFAQGDIGPIAAQHLGLRHWRQALPLIDIAQDKFAGLERRFLGIARRNTGPLDGRLTDPILEAKVFAPRGQ